MTNGFRTFSRLMASLAMLAACAVTPALADHVNSITDAAAEHRKLLEQIAAARKDGDKGKDSTLIRPK